ncbi:MAG TPA: hypothetical protein VMW34_08080 [Anaerolineales bacterium]|jgi:hypothetical protein|nr:hypothetical protein [Anaerolineales bacterium]
MKKSSEIPDVIEESAPADDTDLKINRLDELESRCIKFETTLNDTVTFN